MSQIKEIIRLEIQNWIEKNYEEIQKHRIKFIGCEYFILKENGAFEHSINDEIFVNNEFKFAFAVPKISYFPLSSSTETYLNLIVIDGNLKIFTDVFNYNNWELKFRCHDLRNRPYDNLLITLKNSQNEYRVSIKLSPDLLVLFLNFAMQTIFQCSTYLEAKLLHDCYLKEVEISRLKNTLQRERQFYLDLNNKITSYQVLLREISEMVKQKI